ncbi:hypothetical protein [Sporocytophaga myxococcoides]|uniref:hypothetical protein n=1 Tax=Sporocytophaga myxococcoides TaxID=153721 RepID=UPI0004902044|nr:hypothetical protein [Sporocytophaga myxococcoides]
MLNKISLYTLLLICISIPCFSQQIYQEKPGGLYILKGETTLNLRFDYRGMMVGDMTEEDYLGQKREEKNARSEGKGDYWVQQWEQNKSEDFPKRFEVLFNKYMQKKNIKAEKSVDATYTLIVRTVKLDPGFYTGTIGSQPALADIDFYFVKSDNPEVVLLKLRVKNVEGASASGFGSFDAGVRMEECYAKAGKMLAKYILENGKY